MTVNKYLPLIKEVISSIDPENRNRYFLFGSSTRKEKFNDIDLGFIGGSQFEVDPTIIKEKIEETTLPYFVDVVDFDAASESFKNYVLHNENLLWIN